MTAGGPAGARQARRAASPAFAADWRRSPAPRAARLPRSMLALLGKSGLGKRTPENRQSAARVYRSLASAGRQGRAGVRKVAPMRTERPSPRYSAIDRWDPAAIPHAMSRAHFAAVAPVHP